eukprot:scaffold26360_cov105-Skeletonema_dohrnii-CCMP3373.AAC.1
MYWSVMIRNIFSLVLLRLIKNRDFTKILKFVVNVKFAQLPLPAKQTENRTLYLYHYTARLLLTKYINQCHAPLMSQIRHRSILASPFSTC